MERERALDQNITLESVRLLTCEFELNPDFETERSALEVVFNFDVKRNFPEPNILVVLAKVGLFEHEESRPFSLVIEYEARFTVPSSGEAETLRKFGRYEAPATVVPYLREAIANITGRTTFGPLLLPPLNVKALVDRVEERRGRKSTAP